MAFFLASTLVTVGLLVGWLLGVVTFGWSGRIVEWSFARTGGVPDWMAGPVLWLVAPVATLAAILALTLLLALLLRLGAGTSMAARWLCTHPYRTEGTSPEQGGQQALLAFSTLMAVIGSLLLLVDPALPTALVMLTWSDSRRTAWCISRQQRVRPRMTTSVEGAESAAGGIDAEAE